MSDEDLIAAYLEDDFDAIARQAFDQRLEREPALARRLAGHLLLDLELCGLRSSPGVKSRRRQPRPARWWGEPLVAAAAALVAALLWMAWPAAAQPAVDSGVDIVVAAGLDAGIRA